jgi:hypothetical protein
MTFKINFTSITGDDIREIIKEIINIFFIRRRRKIRIIKRDIIQQ